MTCGKLLLSVALLGLLAVALARDLPPAEAGRRTREDLLGSNGDWTCYPGWDVTGLAEHMHSFCDTVLDSSFCVRVSQGLQSILRMALASHLLLTLFPTSRSSREIS